MGTTHFTNVEVETADGLTVNDVKVPDHIAATAFLPGATAATAANYGAFFIADRAYQVVSVREAHETAGSDASAVTVSVEKLTGTTAPGSGTDLLTAGISLKGTANTVASGTLTGTTASLQLAAGDRLAVKDTGVLTAVAGVAVSVRLKVI